MKIRLRPLQLIVCDICRDECCTHHGYCHRWYCWCHCVCSRREMREMERERERQ